MSQTSHHSASPIPRVELLLVIVISLTGFALRAAYPSRLAVEHFDEGIYASNIWFGQSENFHYPNQHLYAPPLLPTLIELVFAVFGPSNAAAMAVNIVAGSLTIPLLWWVGRRWFGPAAGLAAMTLCAFSDIHIFFSRTALTDVLLCFFLVAAVYLIWEALTAPSPVRLFAAGLVTALAWWTKYSGWLPLAISGAGVVLWMLASRRRRSPPPGDEAANSAGSLLGRGAIIAAIALALWLPYLWSLQDKGGYAAVAANHRQYVVGWSGWWDSFVRQFRNIRHLDSWIGTIGVAGSAFLAAIVRLHQSKPFHWSGFPVSSPKSRFAAASILTIEWVSLSTITGPNGFPSYPALGIACVWTGAFVFGYKMITSLKTECALARWLTTAWGFGLFVSIPLYLPYVRLFLPLCPAGWFCAAVIFCWNDEESIRYHPHDTVHPSQDSIMQRITFWSLFAVALTNLFLFATLFSTADHWESRTGLADLASPLITDACHHAGLDPQSDLNELILDTYGEPALLFQLSLAGVDNVFPVSHLGFARPDAPRVDVPAFVVIGEHARRSADFDRQFAESKTRLELVAEYEYHPSDLVLLDNREPERRPQPGRCVVEKLELYRVR